MMKFILFLIPFYCVFPQINGTVIDEQTKTPLQGVNITSNDIGTVTDKNGQFHINVSPGLEVTVSHIGYESILLQPPKKNLVIKLKILPILGETISVTSTRAKFGESPLTASNITKSEIYMSDPVKDFPALLSKLPSILSYSEGGLGMGYSYLFIRGFDQRKISVFIDGIPQNDPEDHNVYWVNFYDIQGFLEDIQVQRGAGSVHYGPPSIGGSINLVTKQNNKIPNFAINFGKGSYNTIKGSLEFNSGTYLDHFNTIARISYSETDGYRNWSWANFKRFFISTSYNNNNQKIVFHLFGGPQKDGLTYNGVPKEFQNDPELRKTNNSEGKGVERFNQPHFDLIYEWTFFEHFKLNTTLLYLKGEGYFDFNGSWATMEYLRLNQNQLENQYSFDEIQEGFEWNDDWYAHIQKPDIAEKSVIRANVTKKQYGIIQSMNYFKDNLNLDIGYEYRKAFSQYWNRLQNSAEVLSSVSGENGRRFVEFDSGKDIVSIFAKSSYNLNKSLRISSTLQFVFNSYRIENEKYRNYEFEYSYNPFINPRIGINWNFSQNTFIYSQLSVTNREPQITSLYDAADAVGIGYWGGVQPQFDTTTSGDFDFSTPLIRPEKVTDIEFGFGTINNYSMIQGNLFFMKFKNELFISELLGGYAPKYDNIDESLHYGIEMNSSLQINQNIIINSNFSLNESKILVYNDNTNLEGNKIAGFPRIILNGGFNYKFRNLTMNGVVKYIGKQFTTNENSEELLVDPYSNFDLGISYNAKYFYPGIKINLYINNVLNDLYATYGTGESFFMNVPRHFFMDISYRFK